MMVHRMFFQGGLSSLLFLLTIGGLHVARANGDSHDFERGMQLAKEARDETDWRRRDELLTEAQAAFDIPVAENATHESVHPALRQLGSVLSERATLHQKLYDETGPV